MALKIAINGFGRIGRSIARVITEYHTDIKLVAINDLMSIELMEYLLKYDSVHLKFNKEVSIIDKKHLKIGDNIVKVYSEENPQKLNFYKDKADIVIEATGLFLTTNEVKHHIEKGIKRVILSAPSKDDTPTFVLGANHECYNNEKIISNASCTTNCLAPIAKIIDNHFKIKRGFMSTIHSYTNDQNILDGIHKREIRRSRTAGVNIIPTTTGAAKAIGKVLPKLNNKFDGVSLRVPVPNVSIMDLTLHLKKKTTIDEVNSLFQKYVKGELKGILSIDKEFRVSQDFQKEASSGVIAKDLTNIIDKKMLKIMAWYDNEWGYSNRIVEMAKFIMKGEK